MKKSLNPNTGTAVFEFQGKELDINLAGMDSITLCHLALIGAHELLVKRRDPVKSWNDILNGRLKKQKTYPPMIHAVADAFSVSLSDAETFYKDLSREKKILLRKDSRIRKALIDHEETIELNLADLVEPESVEVVTVNQPDSPQPHRKKERKKKTTKKRS